MSIASDIKQRVRRIPRGKPFTTDRFLRLGSRAAIDKTLSRLTSEGTIQRVARGVFVRPENNPYLGSVMPAISDVVETIAKANGETIQVHGAEAARRFRLSTQVPNTPVYYTSGPSREINVGKMKVKLLHTSSNRRLQHAGKKTGLALAALWYLGKEEANEQAIKKIREGLSPEEFELLRHSDMPAWMMSAMNLSKTGAAHG